MSHAEEAPDRYLLAFENGTMPEDRCASRIEAPSDKLKALKARQLELSDAIEEQRVLGLSLDELAAIRDPIRMAIFVSGGRRAQGAAAGHSVRAPCPEPEA